MAADTRIQDPWETRPRKKLTSLLEWRILEQHFQEIRDLHLRELFRDDPGRAERFSVEDCGIFLDYSKNRVTDRTMELLFSLAESEEIGLREAIEAMFTGRPINRTENRAVLHVALRSRPDAPFQVGEENIMEQVNSLPGIKSVLNKVCEFAEEIRQGKRCGWRGDPITNIVNLGIGGSDLGPAMVCEALRPYSDRSLTLRFVSNVDGSHLAEALQDLDPARTLFIVASKTFTTTETMTNAISARKWLLASLPHASAENVRTALARHFVAVSANPQKVAEFGLDPANQLFVFWEWVGGRYSVWSAIGLPIAIAIGAKNFLSFLEGAREIDDHFRHRPFRTNIPVILALLGIWYINFFGWRSYAILPYSQRLARFPAYLQQLDMESNGKQARLHPAVGEEFVTWSTGPVVWGEPGTNGQHAFFQLLHQGTEIVPCDFIGFAQSDYPVPDHQAKLLANLVAQTEALAIGRSLEEVETELKEQAKKTGQPWRQDLVAHKYFPGNRPSNIILARNLDPHTLGKLIAIYEHKIFVQGVIWDINSFDQWGVELGKELAGKLLPALADPQAPIASENSSTKRVIEWIRRHATR